MRADYCSDPRCARSLARDDALCPGCGGTVAGEIETPDDRLEAEDRIRRLERDRGGADSTAR
jgi:hypothetical protein